MKRNTVNYWVDVGIGIAFTLSAISGLVFLLPVGSGSSAVLGLSYLVWNRLHTWSSLALMAGVLTHLVLHRKWIAGMTRKMLTGGRNAPADAPSESRISRRRFLWLGLGAAVTGIIAAGCALTAGTWPGGAEQADTGDGPVESEVERPAPQRDGVACPRGLVNDPYPGRCRHYTDRDGDGFCDYSAPGSGYN